MSLNTQYTVYENLCKMLTYRGIEQTSQKLTEAALNQRLASHEFVLITGKRDASDLRGQCNMVIAFVASGSDYAKTSAEFKRLLANILKTNQKPVEIMIVSENELTNHIKKYVVDFRLENQDVLLECYDYTIFLLEAPAHVLVPKHIIMSAEETSEFLTEFRLKKDQLPKILQSDPQAVWIGLRPGMVVKIIRNSETAGKSVAYRVCVR